MKKFNLLLTALVLVVSSCANDGAKDNDSKNTDSAQTEINAASGDLGLPDGSYILTKEKHLIKWAASKITGSIHSGIIVAENGKFKVENGAINRGVVNFNMNSFEVTDIKDPESKSNFDGHLKSADFFDVEAFPVAKLIMNGSSVDGKGIAVLSFSFEMHGVAIDYNVPFTVTEVKRSEGQMGYLISGSFMLDRTKHKMTYGSGSFFDDLGDRVINDEVKIDFEFTAI